MNKGQSLPSRGSQADSFLPSNPQDETSVFFPSNSQDKAFAKPSTVILQTKLPKVSLVALNTYLLQSLPQQLSGLGLPGLDFAFPGRPGVDLALLGFPGLDP